MSQPAIRIENLSKLYKISTRQNGSYRTLRETITDAAFAPMRWAGSKLAALRSSALAATANRDWVQGSAFSNHRRSSILDLRSSILIFIEDERTYWGEIPGLQGVWARHATLVAEVPEARAAYQRGEVRRGTQLNSSRNCRSENVRLEFDFRSSF